VVFKRRDKRPVLKILFELLWPKGGWARAFYYVRHRLHRLPDTPQRIARGVAAGVFTTFTPFYAFHFIVAALTARLINGNILAALLGTFFGNPLTYIPIGVVSLKTGHFLLGTQFDHSGDHTPSFVGKFVNASHDLQHNFMAMFTDERADWANLHLFYDEVFLPYLVGGLMPGIITGAVFYYLSLPLITAYQNRRSGVLRKKLLSIQAKKREKDLH
jgi:uncharacterized protein (DUF2062 family)